jgi:hypothetical protein
MTPSAAFVALNISESEHPFKYRENEVIKERGRLELLYRNMPLTCHEGNVAMVVSL